MKTSSSQGEPAGRKTTYTDLLSVPDHKVAEIVDGELVVSPRPAARHTLASSKECRQGKKSLPVEPPALAIPGHLG
ncbi:MAG: hypothetical protein RBU30_07465 [Polyangia bacterium]|nr:hypothetical protein [Polyangia bacterium]